MTSAIALPERVTLTDPANGTAITFDCTVSEQHSHDVTITEHPVEDGANVADHAQREMDSLQLSEIVSDQPIVLNPDENLRPIIPGGDPRNRAKQAYDTLLLIQQSYALLDVSTEIRDYENMMITGVSVRRDKETRNILAVDLTLREYRKATLRAVPAPEPIEPVHKGVTDNGRQNTDTPKGAVEQKADTALEAAAEALEAIRGGA